MRLAAALSLLPLAVLLGAARPAQAQAQEDPWGLCRPAIERAAAEAGVPPAVMLAIARVESGRRDPLTGRIEPWPYALNAGGEGRYAATMAEAMAMVQGYQARGQRSVDVGCMQVNLLHHPTAFASLAEAFEPLTNARYAAGFLRRLEQQGGWEAAIGRYHSAAPERGGPYRARVMAAMAGLPLPGGVTAPPRQDPHVILILSATPPEGIEMLRGRQIQVAPGRGPSVLIIQRR